MTPLEELKVAITTLEETITTLALLGRCLHRLAHDPDLFADDAEPEQPVRPDFDYRTGMPIKR